MNNTLITPMYKASRFLEGYLQNIISQRTKPDELLIGVDACMSTLDKITKLHSLMARTGADINVLFFEVHSGPYIIKNTLASLSHGKYLHFFDVDDIMYPRHIDEMCECLKKQPRPSCVYPKSRKKEIGQPDQILNVDGAFSIHRELFFKHNGFEPWPIGADSDFKYRLQDFKENIIDFPIETMSHLKHLDGLTRNPLTGLGTPMRRRYQALVSERRHKKITPEKLHTGEYDTFFSSHLNV